MDKNNTNKITRKDLKLNTPYRVEYNYLEYRGYLVEETITNSPSFFIPINGEIVTRVIPIENVKEEL